MYFCVVLQMFKKMRDDPVTRREVFRELVWPTEEWGPAQPADRHRSGPRVARWNLSRKTI